MQLAKTSWIVRIGYMFAQTIPPKIDRCTLWQRFCLLLVPWLVINFVMWLLLGLLLGVVGQPVTRLGAFAFAGKKLVLAKLPSFTKTSPIICANGLMKLCVLSYEYKNIRWLDWIESGNGPRSPILFLLAVLVVIGVITLFVYNVPTLFWWIVGCLGSATHVVYETSGWWGSGVLALLAAGLLWYAGRRGYKAFATTPSGSVVVAHLKAWKEQHCTIIELV